jgi:hypothetical protein
MFNENEFGVLTETESNCESSRGSLMFLEEEFSHKQFAGEINQN